MPEVYNAGGRSLKMSEWMLFIVNHLFVHFRISSFLSFQRNTKRHVFLLLFVLTPVHLNWPSYATGKCYRSPRQLISTMKHWWLYITIHSLTIFKWKTCNLRLNLIYLSFFCSVYFTIFYQVMTRSSTVGCNRVWWISITTLIFYSIIHCWNNWS